MEAACEAVGGNEVSAAFAKRMQQVQDEFNQMQRVQNELKGDQQKTQGALKPLQQQLETITKQLGTAHARRKKLQKELEATDEEIASLEKRKEETTKKIYGVTADAEKRRADKLCMAAGMQGGVPAAQAHSAAEIPAPQPAPDGGMLDLFADCSPSHASCPSDPPKAGSDVPDLLLLGSVSSPGSSQPAQQAAVGSGGWQAQPTPPLQQWGDPWQQQQPQQPQQLPQQLQQPQQQMQQQPLHPQQQLQQQLQQQQQLQMQQQQQLLLQQQQQQQMFMQQQQQQQQQQWPSSGVAAGGMVPGAFPGNVGVAPGAAPAPPPPPPGSYAGAALPQATAAQADPFDALLMGPLGR